MSNSPRTSAQVSREILGVQTAMPVVVASGLLTDQEANISRLAGISNGIIVTKTIHPNPTFGLDERVQYIQSGMLNSTTYSKRPVAEWIPMLERFEQSGLSIFVNIHAETPEELGSLASTIANKCSFPFELGISCLHADDAVDTAERIYSFSNAVRKSVDRPFAVKLALGPELLGRVSAATSGGASAVTLSDTIPGLAIDDETGQPLLGGIYGYSGPGIKPLVLAEISRLRSLGSTVPVMGCGGVSSAQCVREYLAVGATVVQVYTALHRKMARTFQDIVNPFK